MPLSFINKKAIGIHLVTSSQPESKIIMGNVPLPSPPKATPTKVVTHITTRPLHGKLQLVPSRNECVEKLSVLGLRDDEIQSKFENLEDR